jgi:UDP-glucose 4-epimerase
VTTHESRAFNIATSREMSVLELADAVGRAMGVKPELEFAEPRAGELSRSSLDTAKAQRVLGWTPTHAFTEGLTQLVDWFRGGCP